MIEPYGPAILQGEPSKAKAAVLMSASAIWFRQNPKWYGYPNESILPFCILLMMNHVPFDVLLDEDIANGRLEEYDLLIIPYGDALTRTVSERISAFAKNGKTVIADTTLQSNIPGTHIMNMDFRFMDLVNGKALKKGNAITADEYQQRMETLAGKLEPKLSGLSIRPFRCNSRQVLINEVTTGDIRYVFIINDKKKYGPRFGKWELIQETGVEQPAEIDIRIDGTPAIYDALSYSPLKYKPLNDFAKLNVILPPAQGKLLAILPKPIQKIQVTSPESVHRGKTYSIRIDVLDNDGNSINGAIPLKISLTDSEGKPTEYNQYVATVLSDSISCGYALSFCPAINEPSGRWIFSATELISGKTVKHEIVVE